jgi:membrane protease YdiL (CAAX protease family)
VAGMAEPLRSATATSTDEMPVMAAEMSARRLVVVAIPIAVPTTMAVLFTCLSRCLPARAAYNVGFGIYWGAWCLAFPLLLLGPPTVARLLITGRRLSRGQVALLALPVAGAIGTQLIPYRRQLDPPTAVTMVGTAIINAIGEELLWRGLFMRELADRPRLAKLWSLIGFSTWHVAPQLILPSPLGRWRFVAGSATVGLTLTVAAWRSGGLRQAVIAHILTDACGVRAARFRLGR